MAWSLVDTWGEQATTFLLLVVLARLLGPEEFGLVALAGMLVYIAQDVLRQAVSNTLVQRQRADPQHFTAAFWMVVAVILFTATGFILLADTIAAVFREPLLADLIPWICLVLVLTGLDVVPEAKLMRDLRFQPLALRSILSAALGGAVAILLAAQGYGVWSLIAQQLVSAATGLAVILWSARWLPDLSFSRRHAGDLLALGKYMGAVNIVGLFFDRMDTLLLGLIMGTREVGLFNAAHRIRRLLLNGTVGSVVRPLLPALSQMQDDKVRFTNGVAQSLRLAALVGFPMFIGLACVSREAVAVILGSRWEETTEILCLLSLGAVIQPLGYVNKTAILALGRVRLLLAITIGSSTVFLLGLVVGSFWGLTGIAAAYAISAWVVEPATALLLRRALGMNLARYLDCLLPIAAATLVMAAAILLAKQAMHGLGLSVAIELATYVVLGAVIYVSVLAFTAPALMHTVLSFLALALPRRQSP